MFVHFVAVEEEQSKPIGFHSIRFPKSRSKHNMLVRRFIGKRLADYYAQPSHKVVGRSTELESLPQFSSLLGEWHWKRFFQKAYDAREGHWLTPVELFQPHYSYVLGDFCARYYEQMAATSNIDNPDAATVDPTSSSSSSSIPFEIVELGGGRGTNAKWILSYLQERKPHVYSAIRSYTLVDSSPSLHKAQAERFLDGPHADIVRFELKDLADVAQGTVSLFSKSEIPTVVMGMEVLDNLPHDKIRKKAHGKLEQAEVVKTSQNNWEEKFVPLRDPLLKRVLRTVPQYCSTSGTATWVPSIACGVFDHAVAQRPNLGCVFADFDWLPDADFDPLQNTSSNNETPAQNAPIVTDMEGKDHESYVTAPRHCDILFPTDFEKLAMFCKKRMKTTKQSSLIKVSKQSDFLETWGPEHVAKTKSWLTGHTPLLHDFSNCSVLTISPTAPHEC